MENNNQKNILHIRDHHVIMKPMKSQYFGPRVWVSHLFDP